MKIINIRFWQKINRMYYYRGYPVHLTDVEKKRIDEALKKKFIVPNSLIEKGNKILEKWRKEDPNMEAKLSLLDE